ncbi:TPA: hypothetical protein ACWCGF_003364 [Escherichia coli]
MTYIRKLLFICCSVFFSNTVYAECIDTPAELKAQGLVAILCASLENNYHLGIANSVSSGHIFVTIMPKEFTGCNVKTQGKQAPSRLFNNTLVKMNYVCQETADDTIFFYTPLTEAGNTYIKKQLMSNTPLIVTSPNKNNPFKATFDTHKYREMILDAFNTNDGIRNGI